jgi:hypothetical protein
MATIRVDGAYQIKSAVVRVVDESGNILYEADASPTAEHVVVNMDCAGDDIQEGDTFTFENLMTPITITLEGEAARRINWFFSPMREWMRKLSEYNAKKGSVN